MNGAGGDGVVVYYCRTYVKVRVKRGDVCYGMLRAAACVDESDHHALMYAGGEGGAALGDLEE